MFGGMHIKGANNKAQGDKARINDEIKAKEVRLIGKDGEQAGIVTLAEATKLAEEASLDLVEISPNAEPPVCKVMDYGKFLFEKSKAQKSRRKNRSKFRSRRLSSALALMKAITRSNCATCVAFLKVVIKPKSQSVSADVKWRTKTSVSIY
jgi:translation initiation factor IF-3